MKVIIGEKYKQKLETSLKSFGIKAMFLPINQDIEWQINSHADMQIIRVKQDIFVCEPSIKPPIKAFVGKTKLKSGYPCNIAYNGLIIGNKFFHNLKYTDEILLKLLKENDFELINVKQGFSKCSVLALNDKLAITSDAGMYKALEEEGIKTLKITEGYIELDGYNYGFIGGSGFISGENKVLFTGTLENHIDYIKIKNFLADNFIQYDYLTSKKIFDIGSIIPI